MLPHGTGPGRRRTAEPPGPLSGTATSRRRFLRGAAAGGAAALGAPALLSGCGSAQADSDRLTFWNFYAPQRSDDPALNAQSKWFTDLVAAWNATHDVKVDLLYLPPKTYQTGTKLPTAFAAGSGPDIFLVSPGDFLRYYNGGVLADLTPYTEPAAVEDYNASTLASRTVDGKVYALPMEVEPLAIYYNKGAWEKAGLSEGDVPTTWDALLDVGDKLTTRTRAGLVCETVPGYLQNFLWYPWMWQGGGDVLDKKGRVAVDTPPVRQALKLWQDAVDSGITPRTPPSADDLISAFKADNAAMWQSGIWQVSSFKAYAPKFEYGVFALPVPPGGRYTTALGGWSFCANAQGRNPEAAAEFCGWALGSMEEDCVARMVDWCTRAKSDIAPRTSALHRAGTEGGYDDWAMRYFRDEVFPGGRAEPRYPPVVYKAMSDAIQGTMLAGRDVAEEAARAQQSVAAYVESYEGASLV